MADEGRVFKIFPIFLVGYDPQWPGFYEKEAGIIRAEFGEDVVVHLEHYGSTSIPGLAAKPVIDILLEITSFDIAKRELIPALEKRGYGYDWYAGHMAFFKGYYPVDEPLKYHIHAAPKGHQLMDCLLFRDYLRSHPEEARRYEELKWRLADEYHLDRDGYTDAKGDYVREITDRAKAEVRAGS